MIPTAVGILVSTTVLLIGSVLNRKLARKTRRANLTALRAMALRDSYTEYQLSYKQRGF